MRFEPLAYRFYRRRRTLRTPASSSRTVALSGQTQAAPSRATVAVVFTSLPLADLVGPQPRDLSARAFVDGMRQLGWVDGQNLTIVWRSAEGQPDRYAALATELVGAKVDVIVASGPPGRPLGRPPARFRSWASGLAPCAAFRAWHVPEGT